MTSSPLILLGCRVTLDLIASDGEVETRSFTLVADKQADFKAGLLGESAPLARSLFGRRAGDLIPYSAGDLKAVRVVAVESSTSAPASDAAEKRRAAVQEALAQSEITNQMIFATASGSKWGDYEVDVDRLAAERREKNEGQA